MTAPNITNEKFECEDVAQEVIALIDESLRNTKSPLTHASVHTLTARIVAEYFGREQSGSSQVGVSVGHVNRNNIASNDGWSTYAFNMAFAEH